MWSHQPIATNRNLCADYDAVTPRVQLTFAPNLGVDPVVTCFDMDPLSLDGQIQRASIPLTGEALRCTPYDAAQSIGFGDVFQLETILGENYWHGYVKVDFLDPWDGVNPESYMAIDFIELAVNKDSLGGFGVNSGDRRFEEIRIGDIDGFGWGDGAALAAHDPAVASANDDLVHLPAKLPVNRDGFGLLASGDFLPDINADGAVEDSASGDEPGDDWDRRNAEEAAGTYYTGSGFTRSAASFFSLGSQYTDITLSKSYTASSGEADPVLTGDLARVFGAYPAADSNANVGSNLPGDGNNHPFYFNFYVDPFAIDPAKPLYLTLTHGDLDTSLIEVEVRDIHANSATATLMAAGTTDDGAIESSFVVLDETTLAFDDIFTWDPARNKWHGYLEVRFNNIGASTDEYFAIDFLELSTKQKNIAVPGAGSTLRVPEDFATIQAAINIAQDGSTILVAPGEYRENLAIDGKKITLRSIDPLNSSTVAATIIDGDVDNDGTGDGSVITIDNKYNVVQPDGTSPLPSDVKLADVQISGLTIQHGQAVFGGGVAQYGGTVTIENCVIANNRAAYGGGIANGNGLLRQNTIKYNEAYQDSTIDSGNMTEPSGIGGGVYSSSALWQNKIYNNSAATGGAGIWESNALEAATITNNLVHHNEVTETTMAQAPGAGVHIAERANRPFLVHNTLVDNAWDGAIVNVIDESDSAQLFNNILWDTTTPAPTSPDTDWDRLENSDLRFNVINGAPAKGSDPKWNVGNSPVFTNTALLNYTLQSTSPAIDAGIEFVPPILVDIVSNTRAAATPDIGAYESPYSAPTQGYVSISFPNTITEGDPLQLTAMLSASLQALVNGGATLTWQWYLDSVGISGATNSTHTIPAVGPADSGEYIAVATINGFDYTSGPAVLEVELEDPGILEMIDAPIEVSPRLNNVGIVEVGRTIELSWTIRNWELLPITWSAEITNGIGGIIFGGGSANEIQSFGTAQIVLRITPDEVGPFGTVLEITAGGQTFIRHVFGEAITAGSPGPVASGDIIISEVQTRNATTLADEDDDFGPWVELFNRGNQPVNLHYWALTNDPTDLRKWQLPNVTLPVGEYLVVFASGKDRPDNPDDSVPIELHANFTLEPDGGFVALVEYSATDQFTGVAQVLDVPSPKEDWSYSYIETGGTKRQKQTSDSGYANVKRPSPRATYPPSEATGQKVTVSIAGLSDHYPQDTNTFLGYASSPPADYRFKVNTGEELLQALYEACANGESIKKLYIFSHGFPLGIILDDKKAFYDFDQVELTNIEGFDKLESTRLRGYSKIESLEKLVELELVRFSDDAEIVLTGCQLARGVFAKHLSQKLGVRVIAPIGRNAPIDTSGTFRSTRAEVSDTRFFVSETGYDFHTFMTTVLYQDAFYEQEGTWRVYDDGTLLGYDYIDEDRISPLRQYKYFQTAFRVWGNSLW